jgi:hypothetical protein
MRTDSGGLLDALASPRVTPGMIFCVTGVLLFVVTTLVVRPMQFPSAAVAVPAPAAAAAMPATVVVTASLSSCHAPAGAGLNTDAAAGQQYILHQAAAAAASDPPALALATATLEVDCAFYIGSNSPTSAASAAGGLHVDASSRMSKLMQQPQQGLHGLQQQLQVVGVDVITCAMHAKYPEQHQQQRYVFLLHRPKKLPAGEFHTACSMA